MFLFSINNHLFRNDWYYDWITRFSFPKSHDYKSIVWLFSSCFVIKLFRYMIKFRESKHQNKCYFNWHYVCKMTLEGWRFQWKVSFPFCKYWHMIINIFILSRNTHRQDVNLSYFLIIYSKFFSTTLIIFSSI